LVNRLLNLFEMLAQITAGRRTGTSGHYRRRGVDDYSSCEDDGSGVDKHIAYALRDRQPA